MQRAALLDRLKMEHLAAQLDGVSTHPDGVWPERQ